RAPDLCSRPALRAAAPYRASTGSVPRRGATSWSWRTPPRLRSCGALRRRSTPTGSSIPAPFSLEADMTETADPTAVNGAQALIRTLVACGVDTCFTNPGTSEMHFVAALDAVAEMRGVLGLFEGVVTGAADGYARMAGRPRPPLLHPGPR